MNDFIFYSNINFNYNKFYLTKNKKYKAILLHLQN